MGALYLFTLFIETEVGNPFRTPVTLGKVLHGFPGVLQAKASSVQSYFFRSLSSKE